ncbi:VOC family protein [Deinococcus multiflagellatus]|uniref:VOC family protein n=1 Tax=Deinococcus multiflagellatus TaxID=1656887 RepID=A0ABW1ZN63_9DEIO|nr:VOC family protein [Deinococcus multiflagellatus]MBZ9712408.1 VOC family protein [Deinococcus multiflagellatus]
MPQLQPYLGFNGACQEAMAFYQQCLGGTLDLMLAGESPVAAQMPPELHGHVLHGRLVSGDLTLLASDMTQDTARSQSVSLMLQCASAEEAHATFDRLAEGGTVTHPLGPSFWGSTFGHLTDRYGIHWLLNAEPAPAG